MPLGWIDFSKNERNKVLTVLDLLSEHSTLDELGIAPIRDGFANLFFPGTSTIQTRAKYFFLVAYTMKDVERSSEINPNQVAKTVDDTERYCGQVLYEKYPSEQGIIGSRSLAGGRWVRRTPADIYWAGLKRYDIFRGGNYSRSEYLHAICLQKKKIATVKKLGNMHEGSEEFETDDFDAALSGKFQFWNIPTYHIDWKDDIDIKLSQGEGAFLTEQIIETCPGSMMSYILDNKLTDVLALEHFADLGAFIKKFPKDIQHYYSLAIRFSYFIFFIRTVYNIIVSDGKNARANEIFEEKTQDVETISAVPIDEIVDLLHIADKRLIVFVNNSIDCVKHKNFEDLKNIIKNREVSLKTANRAKTCHPGEFGDENWVGGAELEYRYLNARIIMNDIFESEA